MGDDTGGDLVVNEHDYL